MKMECMKCGYYNQKKGNGYYKCYTSDGKCPAYNTDIFKKYTLRDTDNLRDVLPLLGSPVITFNGNDDCAESVCIIFNGGYIIKFIGGSSDGCGILNVKIYKRIE